MDPAEAKRFLISRVITEADVEHIGLLDVEKKMLAFSESDPSFTYDIREINDEFERHCKTDEYEDKIAQLLKNARDRDIQSSPIGEQKWTDALQALRKEDHYILVMVAQAFHGEAGGVPSEANPASRFLIYLYATIGIILVLIIVWHARR